VTGETINRREFLVLTLSPVAVSAVGIGDAMAATHTVRSGVETRVHFHHGDSERGLDPDTRFTITQPPAHGTARIALHNVSSGTGKPIRVADVFYKSKRGYVGTDSFSYQRTSFRGTGNFTMSVNVVP
jgi:hypothetical protein